ncbi:MAG: gluconate 2-dehydrogenase subunit 3 family protein [Chitinophagaceae bacterium]
MKRRRFLSSVAIIVPVSILGPAFIFSSCGSAVKEEYFSEENINLLNEIGETIIPATTDSPGARAARIGEFIKVYVTDCYTVVEQNTFWTGISVIKELSKTKYASDFVNLTIPHKRDILRSLELQTPKHNKENKVEPGKGDAVQTGRTQQEIQSSMKENTPQFYPLLKNLVLFGYFTSQPGATKSLRYIQTPGSFKGDLPYKKGDKSWAT